AARLTRKNGESGTRRNSSRYEKALARKPSSMPLMRSAKRARSGSPSAVCAVDDAEEKATGDRQHRSDRQRKCGRDDVQAYECKHGFSLMSAHPFLERCVILLEGIQAQIALKAESKERRKASNEEQ